MAVERVATSTTLYVEWINFTDEVCVGRADDPRTPTSRGFLPEMLFVERCDRLERRFKGNDVKRPAAASAIDKQRSISHKLKLSCRRRPKTYSQSQSICEICCI